MTKIVGVRTRRQPWWQSSRHIYLRHIDGGIHSMKITIYLGKDNAAKQSNANPVSTSSSSWKRGWYAEAKPSHDRKIGQVLTLLLSGDSITSVDAVYELKLLSLPAAISYLRHQLHVPIITLREESISSDGFKTIYGRFRIPSEHLPEQRRRFAHLL